MNGSRKSNRDDKTVDCQAATRRLGRPPDPRIQAEVVTAVLRALRAGGYAAVTLERVARHIGRARTSLYRRWPSKRHLVAFAVVSEMGRDPAPDTGSLREDLIAVVQNLYKAFSGPLRQSLAGLVADMAHDPALAQLIRAEVIEARRHSMRAAFARGLKRNEIRADTDIELILDMLTAPFYFRTLFGHIPITRTMTRRIVDYVLRAISPCQECLTRQ
ncbi:MAG TPA: TetR/AcrR family transcriptional regulator [Steroidobacteraceae bacterium]